jgi:hypothetical protein
MAVFNKGLLLEFGEWNLVRENVLNSSADYVWNFVCSEQFKYYEDKKNLLMSQKWYINGSVINPKHK